MKEILLTMDINYEEIDLRIKDWIGPGILSFVGGCLYQMLCVKTHTTVGFFFGGWPGWVSNCAWLSLLALGIQSYLLRR